MRARATFLVAIVLALASPALAQPIPPESIADQEIGWMRLYAHKGATEPLEIDHRVISAGQRSIGMELANWMQATYDPIGASATSSSATTRG